MHILLKIIVISMTYLLANLAIADVTAEEAAYGQSIESEISNQSDDYSYQEQTKGLYEQSSYAWNKDDTKEIDPGKDEECPLGCSCTIYPTARDAACEPRKEECLKAFKNCLCVPVVKKRAFHMKRCGKKNSMY